MNERWRAGSSARWEVSIQRADSSALGPLLEQAGLPPADPDASVWVAREGGAVVGGVASLFLGADVLVRSCVVAGHRRRGGIGALLVDAALVHAAAAGAREAHLVTENAQSFFATLGFRECSSLPDAVAPWIPRSCTDATPMSRTL